MKKSSPRMSFGQVIGVLLFIIAVLFVLVFFIVSHQLEKRDIDLEKGIQQGVKKVEAAGVMVKDAFSDAKDKVEEKVEDIPDEIVPDAEDILSSADDFSAANAEAAEYFID